MINNPRPRRATQGPAETTARRARYRRGAFAERLAAIWLTFKGYRILARRFKTHCGEIDLIAVRGRFVVFIEVKQRASLEAAQASISPRQRKRVRRAADAWLAKNARFREFEIRFDLVFIVPSHWPRHIEGAL